MSNDHYTPLRGKRFRNGEGSTIDIGQWRSCEAMAESAGRHRLTLANHLGLSRSLIDRWCESCADEYDSGARNPLDRIVTWINYLRVHNVDEHRAILPLRWLAERVGYTLHARDGSIVVNDSVLATVGRLVTESSEAVTEALAAVDDGEIDALERKRVDRELRELEAAIADLRVKMRLGAAPREAASS